MSDVLRENDCLRDKAAVLQRKNIWLRMGLQNILDDFGKIRFGEVIEVEICDVLECDGNVSYILTTYSSDIMLRSNFGSYDYNGSHKFATGASIQEVRQVIDGLPAAFEELEDRLNKSICYNVPESLAHFFDE